MAQIRTSTLLKGAALAAEALHEPDCSLTCPPPSKHLGMGNPYASTVPQENGELPKVPPRIPTVVTLCTPINTQSIVALASGNENEALGSAYTLQPQNVEV